VALAVAEFAGGVALVDALHWSLFPEVFAAG